MCIHTPNAQQTLCKASGWTLSDLGSLYILMTFYIIKLYTQGLFPEFYDRYVELKHIQLLLSVIYLCKFENTLDVVSFQKLQIHIK